MFAKEAYSPHGVLLTAVTILCAVSGAVMLSAAGVKLHKRPLFWMAAGTLILSVIFSATRLMLLTAPTQLIYEAYIKLQAAVGAASMVAPFLMPTALVIRRDSAGNIAGTAALAALNILGIVAVLQSEPNAIIDFYPAAFYIALCYLYIWSSKRLFPELAATPEALLMQAGDIILVFDGKDRLIKASPDCREIFSIHDNMTREEFSFMFNEFATIHEDKTVLLASAAERKYYQCSETTVKTRGGTRLATVLMFSDITEITKLKAQLSEKNNELDALNTQLAIALKASEKLEAEQQKEKAISELEKDIGKRLEDLTRAIEAADASKSLSGLIEACRDIMAGVRQTVSRLTKSKEGEQTDD